jgi:hypothetical protein
MKYIITLIMLSLTATFAQAEDFDYVEVNTFVTHSDSGLTIGIRENIDLDESQIIVRKDFTGTPYRLEYRNVLKGQREEHWFRAQMKGFRSGALWYNHRIEHRIRESKDNVFRYRPQFGIKPDNVTVFGGKPFITFEPQFNLTYSSGKAGYSHLQTFTGLEYKVSDKFTVVPYVEVDYNKSFEKDIAFFIVDFKFKL